ncbi:hypothetical protein B0H10DRAFT_1084999 [Mycena sp. CBHHK59/15]|nr:hypothetical protein B0H10DRAFT_1084999 [Mycena sp. CBHHK59/15]
MATCYPTPSIDGWWDFPNFTTSAPQSDPRYDVDGQPHRGSSHTYSIPPPISSQLELNLLRFPQHLTVHSHATGFVSECNFTPETHLPLETMSRMDWTQNKWTQNLVQSLYPETTEQLSRGYPNTPSPIDPVDSLTGNSVMSSSLQVPWPSSTSTSTTNSPQAFTHAWPCPFPSSSTLSSPQFDVESASSSAPVKKCSHCYATSTPLWRRNPTNRKRLCNACGLYLQQRGELRPPALIAADQEESDDDDDFPPGALECSHCHTRRTSSWRRGADGACGVYARLRGRDRPLALMRDRPLALMRKRIRPRCRHMGN